MCGDGRDELPPPANEVQVEAGTQSGRGIQFIKWWEKLAKTAAKRTIIENREQKNKVKKKQEWFEIRREGPSFRRNIYWTQSKWLSDATPRLQQSFLKSGWLRGDAATLQLSAQSPTTKPRKQKKITGPRRRFPLISSSSSQPLPPQQRQADEMKDEKWRNPPSPWDEPYLERQRRDGLIPSTSQKFNNNNDDKDK